MRALRSLFSNKTLVFVTLGRRAQPCRHGLSFWGHWHVLKCCPGVSSLQALRNRCCLWRRRCLEARCEFRALFFKLWSVRGKCACGFRAASCPATDCSGLAAGRSGPRNLTAVFVRLHCKSSQLKMPWKNVIKCEINSSQCMAQGRGRRRESLALVLQVKTAYGKVMGWEEQA